MCMAFFFLQKSTFLRIFFHNNVNRSSKLMSSTPSCYNWWHWWGYFLKIASVFIIAGLAILNWLYNFTKIKSLTNYFLHFVCAEHQAEAGEFNTLCCHLQTNIPAKINKPCDSNNPGKSSFLISAEWLVGSTPWLCFATIVWCASTSWN